jgi:hypothetical protein
MIGQVKWFAGGGPGSAIRSPLKWATARVKTATLPETTKVREICKYDL